MTYTIVRGLPKAPGSLLPTIDMSTTDVILAGVTSTGRKRLIQHDVNPKILAPATEYTIYGKDRGSGKIVAAKREDLVTKTPVDALFNNKPTINCLLNEDSVRGADMTLYDYIPNGQSFTWIAVVSIDPILKSTPGAARIVAQIAPIGEASRYRFTLGMVTGGTIRFTLNGTTTYDATVPLPNVPAANTPFVVAAQFNFSDLSMKIFLNDPSTPRGTATATETPPLTFSERDILGVGGTSDITVSSQSWHGKLARFLNYRAPLTTAQLTAVFNALKTEYGIA